MDSHNRSAEVLQSFGILAVVSARSFIEHS